MAPVLEVRSLAGLALVQDAGRGHRAVGVPRSGAFDRQAHATAAALVGGTAELAGIELVGRITLAASAACTVAVTGLAEVRVGERAVAAWTAFDVPAGTPIEVSTPRRAWLAVAGGLRVPPVLGSRSTCLLGPLGPAPIGVGARLPLAEEPTVPTAGDFARSPQHRGPIGVVPGPHVPLPEGRWTVVEGSRIGVRLRRTTPGAPRAAATRTLPSLGVLPGTVQLLPAGDAIVLGPDAGTMGGYPVAGVVCSAHLDRLAGLMPGDVVDLAAVGAESAPAPTRVAVVHVHGLPG